MYKGSYSENSRKQMIAIFKENDSFDSLHDVIVNVNAFNSFSDLPEDQQEVVYAKLLMVLPDNIMGDIYSWGLSDTVVRDNIYEFIEDNQEELSTLLDIV